MIADVVFLVISLIAILLSAEVFTNGVECLGRSLSLSQAVTGSLLAAVGTALPETILPFVAILLHSGEASYQIGIGAILGAPFMLSTLAFFLVGLTATLCFFKNKRAFIIDVEIATMKRDLIFFLIMYGSAIFVPMLFHGQRVFVALFLVACYFYYAYRTFRIESEGIFHAEELYLKRLWLKTAVFLNPSYCFSKTSKGIFLTVSQVLIALTLMISSAHLFVDCLSKLSISLGVSPLVFALLIAPVATELPEKFNSITWTFKGRDTLAVGNITGAMVFQSTFPVSLGLLFTEWKISGLALVSVVFSLAATALLLANIYLTKRLSPLTAMVGFLFYVLYGILVFIENQSTY